MDPIGIRETILDLIKDYLNERKRLVRFCDYKSHWLSLKIVVPQGTIFGPLLLTIYTDDIFDIEMDDGIIFAYA